MTPYPSYRICVDTGSALCIQDALTKEILCEIPEEIHEKSTIYANSESIFWNIFQNGFLRKIIQIHPGTFTERKIVTLPDKITHLQATKDKFLLAGKMNTIFVYDQKTMRQTGTLEVSGRVKKIRVHPDPLSKMDYLLTIIQENQTKRYKLRCAAKGVNRVPFTAFIVPGKEGLSSPFAYSIEWDQ